MITVMLIVTIRAVYSAHLASQIVLFLRITNPQGQIRNCSAPHRDSLCSSSNVNQSFFVFVPIVTNTFGNRVTDTNNC